MVEQTPPPKKQSAGDRIAANVAALQSQGASEADIEAYLTEQEGLKPEGATTTPPPVSTEGQPGIGSKVLGVIAALNRDIPGAEAAQAGVRALVRRQPYTEALSDIREAEDAAPVAATIPARLAGAGLATAVLPGGAAAKGAQYGGLSALGSAAPESIAERAVNTGIGTGLGYVAGKYIGKGVDKVSNAIGAKQLLQNASNRSVLNSVGRMTLLPATEESAATVPTALSNSDIAAGLAKDDDWLTSYLDAKNNPPQADLIEGLRQFAAKKAGTPVVPQS